jgi:Domain of unknown function (DUF4274)
MTTTDDEDDGLASQRMIAWLRQRGPDDWHFVGTKLNWDSSMDVIQWILDQKDCDKATAQFMFWAASADYYLRFPDREALMASEPFNVGGFDFAKKLADRWNARYYTRSSIAYAPEPQNALARYRLIEAQHGSVGLPWTINDDIGAVRHGADVLSDAEYRNHYSDELAHLLYALATQIPHPDRMHGSSGTVLGRIKGFFGLN